MIAFSVSFFFLAGILSTFATKLRAFAESRVVATDFFYGVLIDFYSFT